MFVEPPTIPSFSRARDGRTTGDEVARNARAALVASALAASILGLVGFDLGVLWVVVGVWAVRVAWGRQPGVAWGIACFAASARWGTLALADVQAATRSVGPALLAGPAIITAALWLALIAAVIDEGKRDSLKGRSIPLQAASIIAVVVLVPLFCVSGDLSSLALPMWAGAGMVLTASIWFVRGLAARTPSWMPATLSIGALFLVVWR